MPAYSFVIRTSSLIRISDFVIRISLARAHLSISVKPLKPPDIAPPPAILSVHTETGEAMAPPTLTAPPPAPAAEPKTAPAQQLRTSQDLFIRRWGEMGATWGINRTMAEIHALLYITAQPLCTDDVMERLHISRGNAGKAAANQETVKLTRQRLGDMEEFMAVTNKVFQQFVGNAKSGLSRVVRVLLKAL